MPELLKFVARTSRKSLRLLAIQLFAVVIMPATSLGFETQGRRGDIVVSGVNGVPPQLVFACDGPADSLERLFSPEVIDDLRELKAGIALSLPDLSVERARIVGRLNQAGIPVTAWLTLPAEQGYYINASNAPEAAKRFREFEQWSAVNGLHWAGIGLDFEPNLQEFAALKNGSKWHIATTLIGRYFDGDRVRQARLSYESLIRKMQADGYSVETYQFPFIADERRARSTLLERLFGIVDVRGDREALMLYTSFHQRLGPALLWVYGADAQAIAVGSTMGPDEAPWFVSLSWDELWRDLIVAHHFSPVIGIYNLEGCVRRGFLPQLKTLDWNQPVAMPAESIRGAEELRLRIRRVIWIVSRLPSLAAVAFVLIAGSIVVWRRRRRRIGVSY